MGKKTQRHLEHGTFYNWPRFLVNDKNKVKIVLH